MSEAQQGAAVDIRVLVADDHDLVRAGLTGLIADAPGVQLVGEARNGAEAVALCERLHPDLVLMDIRMPEMDGLEATRAIKRVASETSVIILTMHESPDYLYEALQAGAAGYLLKDASREDLLKAIREVRLGETMLNPDLAARLLRQMAGQRPSPAASDRIQLTPREREVLRLVAEGMTNREIAERLVVSVSTVKSHVEHVIAKLDVSDRTQAAVRAVELGLTRDA